MNKIPLEKAFNSYFHNEYSFSNFISLDISNQYTNIFHSKNTFSPEVELKKYQKFLNFFIFDFMKTNEDVVFSYRKGVSTYDAVYPHKNSKYILSTDIESFFLHISKNDIKTLILKNSKNYLIHEEDINEHIEQLVNLVTYNNILPIGAPTSPKISNAYLFEFDNKLQKYCTEKGIIYTRYSDDFIFSFEDKDKSNMLLRMMEELLINSDLKNLQLHKTKLQMKGSKVSLLGFVITPSGYITVDKKIKKNIETLLYFYLTDKKKYKDFLLKTYPIKKKKKRKNKVTEIDGVSGVLSQINSVDKNFIIKLKKKYGSYIVNSFIHREIDV